MKTKINLMTGIFLVIILLGTPLFAQVSINADGSAPHPSAMLDVQSGDKGILVPRMTEEEMQAIASPAAGLMVYNLTQLAFYSFNGTAWTKLVAESPSEIKDANGDTKVQVEKNPNEDIIRFDLGGTEKMVLKGNHLDFINPEGNTYLGWDAGLVNTTGYVNVGVGIGALAANTTGSYNTAIGGSALNANTEGTYNTVVGSPSMTSNTTGVSNSAFGSYTLTSNTMGYSNTAIGHGAMQNNITGAQNVALGFAALSANSTGGGNIAIGTGAGQTNSTGNGNVFIGYQAGFSETGSDKLYIANSSTNTPLIGGDFSTGEVTIKDVLNLAPRSAAPSSPSEGALYVDSNDHHIYCYLNGGWKQLD